jgi:hypothetical protein
MKMSYRKRNGEESGENNIESGMNGVAKSLEMA